MAHRSSNNDMLSNTLVFSVHGLDFSSAEAFVRIQRLLEAKDVTLIFCGGSYITQILLSVVDESQHNAHVRWFSPSIFQLLLMGLSSPFMMLSKPSISLIVLPLLPHRVVGKALQGVDLWAYEDSYDEKVIQVFENLNSALEWTENAYL